MIKEYENKFFNNEEGDDEEDDDDDTASKKEYCICKSTDTQRFMM